MVRVVDITEKEMKRNEMNRNLVSLAMEVFPKDKFTCSLFSNWISIKSTLNPLQEVAYFSRIGCSLTVLNRGYEKEVICLAENYKRILGREVIVRTDYSKSS